MSYNVKSISVFEKQAKRLIKKYASLKTELLGLIEELKENPEHGTALGNNCYKIRLAIASNQTAVSKMEHQSKMYISTLQKLVSKLGGHLK